MYSCATQNAFNLKDFKSDALSGLEATRTEWPAAGDRGLLIPVLWFGLSFCVVCCVFRKMLRRPVRQSTP